MVSIKLKFRKSVVPGKEGSCYIQLIHQRKVRTIATGFRLKKTEWNSVKECVDLRRADVVRAKELLLIEERLKDEVRKLRRIVEDCQRMNNSFTVDMIVKSYRSRYVCESFFSIMQKRMTELEKNGQLRTATNYRNTMRMFLDFCKEPNLAPSKMTDCLMKGFESHLRAKGNSMNTISFYMRILQATYNYAVMQGWIQQFSNPFKAVFTGVAKTVKRAVDIEIVRSLIRLNLKSVSDLDLARDMFLFSIYMRGMSFVDLAHLRKENIQDDVLVYRRRKTNQQLHILLPDCAKSIVKKHRPKVKETPYLFPVLHTDNRMEYDNALRLYNRCLNKLAGLVGMRGRLTSYVARHTWATLAKNQGIGIHVISEALGHTSEQTTRIYLDSINNQLVNEANDKIINVLLKDLD